MKNLSYPRLLAAACTLAFAQFAQAHAHPKVETPAPNSVVDNSVSQVQIVFDDGLEGAFSSLSVSNAAGQTVTTAKSLVAAADHKVMTVALPKLSAGVYTVRWVAVAEDSHRTHGDYTFTVK
jgi:methionine-rich copper-binding protein CopC